MSIAVPRLLALAMFRSSSSRLSWAERSVPFLPRTEMISISFLMTFSCVISASLLNILGLSYRQTTETVHCDNNRQGLKHFVSVFECIYILHLEYLDLRYKNKSICKYQIPFQVYLNYSSKYFAVRHSLTVITLFGTADYDTVWHLTTDMLCQYKTNVWSWYKEDDRRNQLY